MPTIEELAQRKVRLLEQAPEQLATDATRIQREIWERMTPLVQSLEVDADGRILQNNANINRVSTIIEALNVLLTGEEYRLAVTDFLNSIDDSILLTDEIAKNIERGFQPSEVQKRLVQLVKQSALNSLVGGGLRSAVSQPFAQQLLANVSARTPLREATQSLRKVLVGDATTDGRIAANVKTVATTAQAVADRSYSTAVYEDLSIEFFRYIGGEIDTTRDFCEHRVKKVFHKKEIEAWGEGKNAGGINDIKNGTWAGRIAETDGSSIFTNLGGWNCRHSLVPVTGRRVPKDVRERAEKEGYI